MCVRWISWQCHFEENALPLSHAPHFFYNQKDFVTSQWAKWFFSCCCVSRWRFAHCELKWTMNRCTFQQARNTKCLHWWKGFIEWILLTVRCSLKAPGLAGEWTFNSHCFSVCTLTHQPQSGPWLSVPWSCRSIFWPSVAEICLITDLTGGWPDSREVVVSSGCFRWQRGVSFSPFKPTLLVFCLCYHMVFHSGGFRVLCNLLRWNKSDTLSHSLICARAF